jgi:antitoxin MazE
MGDTLAVWLPTFLVDALDLKEGDQIEIHIVDKRRFSAPHKALREELLKRL